MLHNYTNHLQMRAMLDDLTLPTPISYNMQTDKNFHIPYGLSSYDQKTLQNLTIRAFALQAARHRLKAIRTPAQAYFRQKTAGRLLLRLPGFLF